MLRMAGILVWLVLIAPSVRAQSKPSDETLHARQEGVRERLQRLETRMLKLAEQWRLPVVVFAAEDYELVGWYGDRTLARYRAIAARQLGPACPFPGAAVPPDELAATLADWLDEFERVHLLLRLSARLRQKHGD